MSSLSTLFTSYLIYPILGIVFGVVAFLIAKKNGLLKNKRLIVYTLLSVLILAIPALLGFLDYDFMPYAYIVPAGAYLITGYCNNHMLPWVFDKEEIKYRIRIIYILFQVIIAMLLFALAFNLCNELKYGLWASTCMITFVLAPLLVQTYELFIRIPLPIYKVWTYETATGHSAPDNIDHNSLKVVSVELFKQEGDKEPARINAKVPDEMLVGDWMKLLFKDYNKKFAHSPIHTHGGESSGWVFYIKPWILSPRRYLDPELTVRENQIREKNQIIAKRVKIE